MCHKNNHKPLNLKFHLFLTTSDQPQGLKVHRVFSSLVVTVLVVVIIVLVVVVVVADVTVNVVIVVVFDVVVIFLMLNFLAIFLFPVKWFSSRLRRPSN